MKEVLIVIAGLFGVLFYLGLERKWKLTMVFGLTSELLIMSVAILCGIY